MNATELRLQKYHGHKTVNATPMTRQQYSLILRHLDPANEHLVPRDENPDDLGFFVEHPDLEPNVPGFNSGVSWVPAGVFNPGYRSNGCLTFGDALEAMKLGAKVIRPSWEKRDVCAYIQHRTIFIRQHGVSRHWNPSTEEIVAEDWLVLSD